MKLRFQLLLAGALTLILPALAYRAVHQMDTALRESRVDEQIERVRALQALMRASGHLQDFSADTARSGGADSDKQTPNVIYAELLQHSIFLDGYADDWVGLEQDSASYLFIPSDQEQSPASAVPAQSLAAAGGVQMQAAVSGQFLYLFLKVKDQRVVFHDPSLGFVSSGDHVEVSWQSASPKQQNTPPQNAKNDQVESVRRYFSPIATGNMQASYYGQRFEGLQPIRIDNQSRAALAIVNDGYQLELRIPRPRANSRFGFAVVDRNKLIRASDPGNEYRKRRNSFDTYSWAGSHDPSQTVPLASIVFPSEELQIILRDVVPAGTRLRVFDSEGWLRADINRLYDSNEASGLIDPQKSHIFNALLFRFFEWIIQKQQQTDADPFTPDGAYRLVQNVRRDSAHKEIGIASEQLPVLPPRSYLTRANDYVTGTLQPIGDDNGTAAWMLLETNDDRANAFTSSAMVRVFSLVTAVSMLVAASLLVFATWLSFRIRRLSRQTLQAISPEGRFVAEVAGSRYRDEIGDLSRDFASLVERSRGYTQYLETLSAKLSHELRTPLSVVQTSLENIDTRQLAAYDRLLISRAQSGSEQLSALLRSMSEATRLEQAIESAQFRDHQIDAWLEALPAVYQSIYPERVFAVRSSVQAGIQVVVPELLQQALDKLIANAVDFSPAGSEIIICLDKDTAVSPLASHCESLIRLAVENEGSQLDSQQPGTLFEPMISLRQGRDAMPVSDAADGLVSQRQGESRIAPHETHLGLGLYIVKLVAECHRGEVFAKNLSHGVHIGFSFKSSDP